MIPENLARKTLLTMGCVKFVFGVGKRGFPKIIVLIRNNNFGDFRGFLI
jgi:hypothetical protein